jgi:hypothetical protein
MLNALRIPPAITQHVTTHFRQTSETMATGLERTLRRIVSAKRSRQKEDRMSSTEEQLQQRIRERAYQIWLEEGRPEGRAEEHWRLAEFAIAEQDGLQSTLIPPAAPEPEPIEAVLNQAEFPTLVDQGEGLAPAEWGYKKEPT